MRNYQTLPCLKLKKYMFFLNLTSFQNPKFQWFYCNVILSIKLFVILIKRLSSTLDGFRLVHLMDKSTEVLQ